MTKRKTHDIFVGEVFDLVGSEYDVIGTYENNHSKIKMIHNVCKATYEVSPSSFLGSKTKRGARCPFCAGNKKKSISQFKNEIHLLTDGEYTVTGEYNGRVSETTMKHNVCGFEFKLTPKAFLSLGQRCPKCTKERVLLLGRKTHSQFLEDFYSIYDEEEYEVLSEYSNARNPVKVKHLTCGRIRDFYPYALSQKSHCSECSYLRRGEKKRKTHDQFAKELYELFGDEYIATGLYSGANKKISILHTKCGREYDVFPSNILQGKECGKCLEDNQTNTEKFKEKIEELTGGEYTLLGDFKDWSSKVLLKHVKCRHEYGVLPYNFMKGTRCPKCAKRPQEPEVFSKKVHDLVGDEYVLLVPYTGVKNDVKLKHKLCNHEYFVLPNNFLKGQRCPKCGLIEKGRKRRTSHNEFIEQVKIARSDEYKVLSEYKTAKDHVMVEHKACGHSYLILPDNLLKGRNCPKCSIKERVKNSKGEFAIKTWLENKGIEFNLQHTFDGCKNKNHLPFDFAIVDDNEIVSLIEYDGELHFMAIDYFGGEKGLKRRQRNDSIKTNYCKENNIPLIRIPYWDFDNIETILEEHFKNIKTK